MVQLVAGRITDLGSSGLSTEELMRFLPGPSREKLRLITNPESLERSLLGELLARYCLVRFAGLDPGTLTFGYAEKGKPYLMGHSGIYFNISHSAEMVVCGLAASEVGIDVEHFRKVNLRVAERYFSPVELEDLMALEGISRDEYFFTLWTIKESYLKAIGSGLTRSLSSFTVVKSDGSYSLTGDEHAPTYSLATYRLSGGYFLAACCAGETFPGEIPILRGSEILDYLGIFN